MVANLGAGEHQFLQHQLVGNTEVIGDPLVTLEFGTVATHAIVGEGPCAILQSRLVRHIDVDFFQFRTMALGSKSQGRQRSKNQSNK